MDLSNPIKVLELLLKNKEWLSWEPETIWKTIDDMYPELPEGEPEIPRQLKDTIMAIKLCFQNEMPWTQWNIFNAISLTFNNEIISFHNMDKPSLGQIAYTVYVLNKIRVEDFSEEVKNFIACVAKYDGFILLPDILSFAQERLDLITNKKYNKQIIADAYKKYKFDKSLPSKMKDNDILSIQLMKIIAIDDYVESKIPKKDKFIIKLSSYKTIINMINKSTKNVVKNIIEPIKSTITSFRHGASGFTLNKEQAEELSKYISLNDNDMIAKSAREGIIFNDIGINFRVMSDKDIIDNIKKHTQMNIKEIAKIYRELYKAIYNESSVYSMSSRMGNIAGSAAYRVGHRLNSFLMNTILRKKTEDN